MQARQQVVALTSRGLDVNDAFTFLNDRYSSLPALRGVRLRGKDMHLPHTMMKGKFAGRPGQETRQGTWNAWITSA